MRDEPSEGREEGRGTESYGGDQDAEGTASDDRLVREEEDVAAAEAARIGGRSGMEGMDPAERASAEHGGGESEGFEEAEELLEEQASHGDPGANPLADASEAEAEPDPGTYGEGDEVDSTETDADTEGTH